MRISDWSSDVCSSDLADGGRQPRGEQPRTGAQRAADAAGPDHFGRGARDRKSVVAGKSVSVRVDLGGRRILKKKQNTRYNGTSQYYNHQISIEPHVARVIDYM